MAEWWATLDKDQQNLLFAMLGILVLGVFFWLVDR